MSFSSSSSPPSSPEKLLLDTPGTSSISTSSSSTSTSSSTGSTSTSFTPMFNGNGNNNHNDNFSTNSSMMTSIDEDSVEVMMNNPNESKDETGERNNNNSDAVVPTDAAATTTTAMSRPNRRPSTLDLGEQLRLSTVSGLFDRQHKGYLDPTEKAMRRMDSQNRGYLDNEKVYKIMSSLQEEQKKSAALIESLQMEHQKAMSLKRGILYMSAFAFVLAISNIGTSFAAARLAKDITVQGDNLVATNGSTRLSTTAKSVVLQLDALETPVDPERRRLHERFLQDATTLACGPKTDVDFSSTGDRWETTNTDSITGDNTTGSSPTIQCNTVGRITYDHAQTLYSQFCPWPQPAGAATPQGCDLGLAELLLVCGSRKTRILGGDAFPDGGVPALDGSGQYFVFPSPERDVPVGESMSLYFSALQLVEEPIAQFSLTSNPPPMTCEERFHFKLYCDPTNGQGCLLISLLWNNQRNCQGEIQMCATSTGAQISRRASITTSGSSSGLRNSAAANMNRGGAARGSN